MLTRLSRRSLVNATGNKSSKRLREWHSGELTRCNPAFSRPRAKLSLRSYLNSCVRILRLLREAGTVGALKNHNNYGFDKHFAIFSDTVVAPSCRRNMPFLCLRFRTADPFYRKINPLRSPNESHHTHSPNCEDGTRRTGLFDSCESLDGESPCHPVRLLATMENTGGS